MSRLNSLFLTFRKINLLTASIGFLHEEAVAGLGFVAVFNKGISGGGYGPMVTGGQVLAGVRGRSAVGIASLAEGITGKAGVLAYLGSGAPILWQLAPSLLLGAMLSVPIATYVVSRLPVGRLTLATVSGWPSFIRYREILD